VDHHDHPPLTIELLVGSETLMRSPVLLPAWKLYIDGASNINDSGAGIILISPKEQVLEYDFCFEFLVTNNIAEYKVLQAGLCLA